MSHRIRLWLSYSTLLALVSCGGGGGGSGDSGGAGTGSVTGGGFAPTSGPGDVSGYFPAGTGDQWVFDYTNDDPNAPAAAGSLTVTVTGTKTIQGATATVYSRVNSASAVDSYDQYFAVTNGGVTALGNTDPSDTFTPLIIPYVQMLFPISVGSVSSVSGQNLPYGTDSNNNAITLDLTQNIANAAMETVDVPAGTFPGALRQNTDLSTTLHDSGQSGTATGNDVSWYFPGAGEIKEQSSAMGGGTSLHATGALRRYMINGVWHGIGPSDVLDPEVRSAACTSSQPVPSVSSDGANFLIVSYGCSTSSGSGLSNWVATFVDANGATIRKVNITQPAAEAGLQSSLHAVSAFDGTHYLVVYETDIGSYTTVSLQSVVLAVDGTIVAGPTTIATGLTPNNNLADREALAFGGSQFLLAYIEAGAPPLQRGISGLFIAGATGQPVGTAVPVSNGELGDSPVIAFDGENYLVAWVKSDTAPVGLRARRVAKTGAVVDAAPFSLVDLSIGPLTDGCCDLEPTLAFDGTNYLAAYRELRNVPGVSGLGRAGISAARISTAGTILDGTATSPGIVVAPPNEISRGWVKSVFMAGYYWLVWESNAPTQLNATRVSAAGVVSSAWTDGFVMAPAGNRTQFPQMAESSAGPLLIWTEGSGAGTPVEILGLRVYPTGP